MTTRTLQHPPLVEHVFEARWDHADGRGALYDEYEVSLGMLYERIKGRLPRRERASGHLPSDVYEKLAVEGLVFDRFVKEPSLHGLLHYPLAQYGPGVASYNVDKSSYRWTDVKAGILDYFGKLSEVHDDLASRIVALSLRSIDFFETEEPGDYLRAKFKVEVKTELASLNRLDRAKETPRFQTLWALEDEPIQLRVGMRPGSVGDANGLVLDIQAQAQREALTARGIESLVDFLHGLTGDAFFALLTPELHDELGRVH